MMSIVVFMGKVLGISLVISFSGGISSKRRKAGIE
jgi:hypothetical protein